MEMNINLFNLINFAKMKEFNDNIQFHVHSSTKWGCKV
jgi:hypothetical protein